MNYCINLFIIRNVFKNLKGKDINYQLEFFDLFIQLFLVDSENSEILHQYYLLLFN